MNLRTGFASLIALSAFASGCSAASDTGVATVEAHETTSRWSLKDVGEQPHSGAMDGEGVTLAVDAQGHRHVAYVGREGAVEYSNESTGESLRLGSGDTGMPDSSPRLAIDLAGEPHVVFGSAYGVMHGAHANGEWSVTPTGAHGAPSAFAIDRRGMLHFASNDIDVTNVSTLPAGATQFQHTAVPHDVDAEVDILALAVDATGAETLLLHSWAPWGLDDRHNYVATRPAGGRFTVETMDPSLSAAEASLAIGADGTLHAVLAVRSDAPDHAWMDVYTHRGRGETTWSAPEEIARDSSRSALLVDGSGALHVAFTGYLRTYAGYATRRAGGGWTVEDVTFGTWGIRSPAIALDPSGDPVMSFATVNSYWLAERAE